MAYSVVTLQIFDNLFVLITFIFDYNYKFKWGGHETSALLIIVGPTVNSLIVLIWHDIRYDYAHLNSSGWSWPLNISLEDCKVDFGSLLDDRESSNALIYLFLQFLFLQTQPNVTRKNIRLVAAYLYDAIFQYAMALNNTLQRNQEPNGRNIIANMLNSSYTSK